MLAKELEMLRIEMRQGREGEENYGLDRKGFLFSACSKRGLRRNGLVELNQEQRRSSADHEGYFGKD